MQIPLKYLMRQSAFWNSVRATPVLVPVAGVLMILLSPSVMAGGFTIGALSSTPINYLLKLLFKWLHYQINGDYKGATFLGQGSRPLGAKGSGCFLEYPLKKPTSWGMPSGHSQLAWYVAGFLIGYLLIWRPRAFSVAHKAGSIVAIVLAALVVSFSRVWVEGVHTPGQVLVGGLIGFVLGLITLAITRAVANKYFNETFANANAAETSANADETSANADETSANADETSANADETIDMMASNEKAAEDAQIAAKKAADAKAAIAAFKTASDKKINQ
jgi:hypothetical protein